MSTPRLILTSNDLNIKTINDLINLLNTFKPEKQKDILDLIDPAKLYELLHPLHDLYYVYISNLSSDIKATIIYEKMGPFHLMRFGNYLIDLQHGHKNQIEVRIAKNSFDNFLMVVPKHAYHTFVSNIFIHYDVYEYIHPLYDLFKLIKKNCIHPHKFLFHNNIIRFGFTDYNNEFEKIQSSIYNHNILNFALSILPVPQDKIDFIFYVIGKMHFKKIMNKPYKIVYLSQLTDDQKKKVIKRLFSINEIQGLFEDMHLDNENNRPAYQVDAKLLTHIPTHWHNGLLNPSVLEKQVHNQSDLIAFIRHLDPSCRYDLLNSFTDSWIANMYKNSDLEYALDNLLKPKDLKNFKQKIRLRESTVIAKQHNNVVSTEEIEAITRYLDATYLKPRLTQTDSKPMLFFPYNQHNRKNSALITDGQNNEVSQRIIFNINLLAITTFITLSLTITMIAWLYKVCMRRTDDLAAGARRRNKC